MKCHIVRRIQTSDAGEVHLQMFRELPIVPSPGWTLRDANGRVVSVESTRVTLHQDGVAEILCALEQRDAVDLSLEAHAGWSAFP